MKAFISLRRSILQVLPVVILVGCSAPEVYRLDTAITSPSQAQANSFEDDQIAASFEVTQDSIAMKLKNKTRKPLKILWTQSNFIDVEGQPHGITHMAFRPPPRGVKDTPSTSSVPPGAELSDTIILFTHPGPSGIKPAEPFFEGLAVGQGQWPEERLRKTYTGKTFVLLLTIQTDTIIPYRFRFRINDFNLVKSR